MVIGSFLVYKLCLENSLGVFFPLLTHTECFQLWLEISFSALIFIGRFWSHSLYNMGWILVKYLFCMITSVMFKEKNKPKNLPAVALMSQASQPLSVLSYVESTSTTCSFSWVFLLQISFSFLNSGQSNTWYIGCSFQTVLLIMPCLYWKYFIQ